MSERKRKEMIKKLSKMTEGSKQFEDQKRRILSLRLRGRLPHKSDKDSEDNG